MPAHFNFSRFLRFSTLGLFLTALLPPAFAVTAEDVVAQPVAREVRCPVCGMYPARYPKWMAQVVFQNRDIQAFDSPADLLRYLQNMAKYDKKHVATDIAAIFLSDFAKGGWIEAKRAYLVTGSSTKGPMNNADLPAFGSKAAAEQHAQAYGGKVLAFDQMTPEVSGSQNGHDEHADHDHAHQH